MPVYRYKCTVCGNEQDGYNTIDNRKTDAPECHGKMEIKIMPSGVVPDIEAFVVPGTSDIIHSRSDRRNYMRKHGLTEVGNEGRPESNDGR